MPTSAPIPLDGSIMWFEGRTIELDVLIAGERERTHLSVTQSKLRLLSFIDWKANDHGRVGLPTCGETQAIVNSITEACRVTLCKAIAP